MIAAFLFAAAASVPEVVVEFDISRKGTAEGIRIARSEGCRFDEAAIGAVRDYAKEMYAEAPGSAGRRWQVSVKFVPTDPPKVADIEPTAMPEPGAVTPPQLIHDPPPRYPKKAKGRSGHVELKVQLDVRGNPGKVEVVDATDSMFEGPAKVAVRNWTWQPARKGAETVPAEITVCVFFEPEKD